jgi:prepilin-type N-terminal cleavage/methylation domain-containing protein
MTRATHTTRRGFSLVEMLVVVSIITIILALTFPMIGAMQRDSSTSSGVNTIAITVASARRYATDPKYTFALTDINPDPLSGSSEPGLFSGVAAVFTPAGEIRLVKNFERARFDDPSTRFWYLERHGPFIANPVITSPVQSPGQPKRELNGFRDINIDYVLLGSDVGVVGITRNRRVRANDAPLLLPPPFAIWFDQNGYMVTTGQDATRTDNDYQFVYYDGNYDGSFNCLSRRFIYDPGAYNPNSPRYDARFWNATAKKYVLPFEKLEAVIGVYVYSLEAFDNAVDDGILPAWNAPDPQANNLYWAWMRENGEMMLFSRQTGMLMRNRDE